MMMWDRSGTIEFERGGVFEMYDALLESNDMFTLMMLMMKTPGRRLLERQCGL